MAVISFDTLGQHIGKLFNRKNATIVPYHKSIVGEYPESVPFRQLYQYYHQWSQVQRAINSIHKRFLGAGIDVVTNDEEFTKKLQTWCDVVNLKSKLSSHILDTLITGNGFLELQFTGDSLASIEHIPTITFWRIFRDSHAKVVKYVQLIDGIQNELDPQYVIHYTINNPEREAFGKSEFYTVAAPRQVLGKINPETGEQVNADRFIPSVLDMAARNLHAEMEYKEKMARGRLFGYAEGMPHDQMKQLESEINDPASDKFFWILNHEMPVSAANLSAASLDRYTDNMNREVDMGTGFPSNIINQAGNMGFASSQTPIQELQDRVKSMQNEYIEVIQDRIFRLLARQWNYDYEETQPKLIFKPIIAKLTFEDLIRIPENRISDDEFRENLSEYMALNDEEFEKSNQERKEQLKPVSDNEQPQPESNESVFLPTPPDTAGKPKVTDDEIAALHKELKLLKEKMAEEFDEAKHPRGQPNNAGQFVKKGNGSAKKSSTVGKKDSVTTSTRKYKHITPQREKFLRSQTPKKREEWFGKIHTTAVLESYDFNNVHIDDLAEISEDIWNKHMNSDTFAIHKPFSESADANRGAYIEFMHEIKNSDHEKFSSMFEDVINNTPELQERFKKVQKQVEKYDIILDQKYKTNVSFYRGTSVAELDNYIESGTLGSDETNYNYTAMSLSENVADNFSKGVTISYDADDIRAIAKRVEYTAIPQPNGVSSGLKNYEESGKPMSFGYSGEQELRVKDGADLPRIKKIHFDDLGEPFNPDGIRKTYGQKVNALVEKYGHLSDRISVRAFDSTVENTKGEIPYDVEVVP